MAYLDIGIYPLLRMRWAPVGDGPGAIAFFAHWIKLSIISQHVLAHVLFASAICVDLRKACLKLNILLACFTANQIAHK